MHCFSFIHLNKFCCLDFWNLDTSLYLYRQSGNQIHLIKCKTTCYEVKLKLTLNSRFKSCAFMKIACRLYLSLFGWMKLEIYGFGLGIFLCSAIERKGTCVTPRQISNNHIFSGKVFAPSCRNERYRIIHCWQKICYGQISSALKWWREKTDGILSAHANRHTHINRQWKDC